MTLMMVWFSLTIIVYLNNVLLLSCKMLILCSKITINISRATIGTANETFMENSRGKRLQQPIDQCQQVHPFNTFFFVSYCALLAIISRVCVCVYIYVCVCADFYDELISAHSGATPSFKLQTQTRLLYNILRLYVEAFTE